MYVWNGTEAIKKKGTGQDVYRHMTIPKACQILGIRDREFRESDLEYLRMAFSKRVNLTPTPHHGFAEVAVAVNSSGNGTSDPNPEQPKIQLEQPQESLRKMNVVNPKDPNHSMRMKHFYKNHMRIHEAYQFLHKKRSAQLEQERKERAMLMREQRMKQVQEEENARKAAKAQNNNNGDSNASSPLNMSFDHDDYDAECVNDNSSDGTTSPCSRESRKHSQFREIVSREMRRLRGLRGQKPLDEEPLDWSIVLDDVDKIPKTAIHNQPSSNDRNSEENAKFKHKAFTKFGFEKEEGEEEEESETELNNDKAKKDKSSSVEHSVEIATKGNSRKKSRRKKSRKVSQNKSRSPSTSFQTRSTPILPSQQQEQQQQLPVHSRQSHSFSSETAKSQHLNGNKSRRKKSWKKK